MRLVRFGMGSAVLALLGAEPATAVRLDIDLEDKGYGLEDMEDTGLA